MSLEHIACVDRVQSCLSPRLQPTVPPGAEVHVMAVCGKSTEHSSKQDECSGSAAFVVAPSGCFLRKLLWPVCAGFIRKYRLEIVSIYILLNLCLTGLFFSLFLLHHLSCVLHMVTQP